MQRLLDRLLAFHRFNPLHAFDVAAATVIAEREHIDAFVVDLKLGPGHSGLEMVAWLRRQRGYTTAPVFLLTGNLDIPEDTQTAIRRHGANVFYKGQSLELLIDCLWHALLPTNDRD